MTDLQTANLALPREERLSVKWLHSHLLKHCPASLKSKLRSVTLTDEDSLWKHVANVAGLVSSVVCDGDDPMIGSLGGRPPFRGGGFRPPFRGGGFRPPFRPPPARLPAGHPPGPRGACYRCGKFHWAVGPNRTPCPSPPLAGSAVGSLESYSGGDSSPSWRGDQ